MGQKKRQPKAAAASDGRRQRKRRAEPQGTRRGFLQRAWIVLGGVAVAEGAWVASDFLGPRKPRAKAGDDRSLLVAGPVERFAPGSVTAFPEAKLYLVRLEDGGFLALSRECTHLGCTVPWDAERQRFLCPCHASAYDLRGSTVSPPAPRPLDRFAVRIENGIVKIDGTARLERKAFEMAQVVQP